MCIVTISSRYQIAIPKEIRERFDLNLPTLRSNIRNARFISLFCVALRRLIGSFLRNISQ